MRRKWFGSGERNFVGDQTGTSGNGILAEVFGRRHGEGAPLLLCFGVVLLLSVSRRAVFLHENNIGDVGLVEVMAEGCGVDGGGRVVFERWFGRLSRVVSLLLGVLVSRGIFATPANLGPYVPVPANHLQLWILQNKQ